MKPDIWIVILAAGYARRMGSPKLLLPIDKESMLRHVTRKALRTRAIGVAIVVNGELPELMETIDDLDVVILPNHEASLGMSASVRIAVSHLEHVSSDAGVIMLADQPGMDPSVIEQVMERYAETKAPVVQPAYQGKPGHPVLFGKAVYSELRNVNGDQGGRHVVAKYASERELVNIDSAEPEDIDVLDDYFRLIAKGGSSY
ncbi:nucleotidyltransferase family protein [Paenibacillus sp. sgz302251]|uniref:nucleotidyltransferase family protein n=1 Tax=Paenibacillus sp. sgz302251 TaxID=3414493 RepID=UPI003C7BDB10